MSIPQFIEILFQDLRIEILLQDLKNHLKQLEADLQEKIARHQEQSSENIPQKNDYFPRQKVKDN